MKLTLLRFQAYILLAATIVFFGFGCSNSKEAKEEKAANEADTSSSQLLRVNGEIFSIPSPIQTAFLIKESGANFNKDMLNPSKNQPNYTTNFKKALNLGVYGADLGYVSLYDQTQEAIKYMQSVKKLADDVGVTGAFDNSLVTRFQNNIGVQDSLLVLVSSAFRASDAYLKNNQRNDISSLILVGGWVESINFAINADKQKASDAIKRRIVEQKSALQSIIKLLGTIGSKPEYTDLIEKLKDLAASFEKLAPYKFAQ